MHPFKRLLNQVSNDCDRHSLEQFLSHIQTSELSYYDVKMIYDGRKALHRRVRLASLQWKGWKASYDLAVCPVRKQLLAREGMVYLMQRLIAHEMIREVRLALQEVRVKQLRSLMKG